MSVMTSKLREKTNELSKKVNWEQFHTSINKIKSLLVILWPYILGIILLLGIFYYITSYYYDLKRRYKCTSLVNLFEGNLHKCYTNAPDYCKDVNSKLHWGWCNDPDYHGAYPGNSDGPYAFTCNQWITNPKKCPPLQCSGEYPLGINTDSKTVQEYGWCADPNVNKSMKGTSCGPNGPDNCKNWVWDSNKCLEMCPTETKKKKTKVKPEIKLSGTVFKNNCSIICGNQNGQNIPCPPPDCMKDSTKCSC